MHASAPVPHGAGAECCQGHRAASAQPARNGRDRGSRVRARNPLFCAVLGRVRPSDSTGISGTLPIPGASELSRLEASALTCVRVRGNRRSSQPAATPPEEDECRKSHWIPSIGITRDKVMKVGREPLDRSEVASTAQPVPGLP